VLLRLLRGDWIGDMRTIVGVALFPFVAMVGAVIMLIYLTAVFAAVFSTETSAWR